VPELKVKSDILERNGFVYDFSRGWYINENMKKIFSVQVVNKNTPEWLRKCIAEKLPDSDYEFYFTKPPSVELRKNLMNTLGE